MTRCGVVLIVATLLAGACGKQKPAWTVSVPSDEDHWTANVEGYTTTEFPPASPPPQVVVSLVHPSYAPMVIFVADSKSELPRKDGITVRWTSPKTVNVDYDAKQLTLVWVVAKCCQGMSVTSHER